MTTGRPAASELWCDLNRAAPQRIVVAAPAPEEPPPRTYAVEPGSRLEAAVCYVERMGWPVFPIRDRKPSSPHGHLDASKDPEQLRIWFEDRWGAEWLPD